MKPDKTRTQWAMIMADWEAGETPQREFCAGRGLSYSAFSYWRGKVKEGLTLSKGQPRVIEVSCAPLRHEKGAANAAKDMRLETKGIVIPVAGSKAKVTIVGRVRLCDLGRILSACAGTGDEYAQVR